MTLLRRLAGRVPDEYLQVFRGYLAAAEWKMLVTSLSGYLVDRRIALATEERRLLDEVAGPEVSAKLPEADPDQPAYRFISHGPDPGSVKDWLISVAPKVPGVRRVLAAYREPANAAAIPLATWVYLVETDPGADVARLQGDLRPGDPRRGVVEVFAAGEPLPPYHVEALRAAREVWVRDT
ncbi:hypothetical protein [Actinophytocola sp.]|uniref:hypothetical protein n=1 Tax=Actinophytocola sp. TaxID=1872138 RepID=UPI0038998915